MHALARHGGAAVAPARSIHRHHPIGTTQPGGPNGGLGLIRLGLPNGFLDYGVVTLWNNTRTVTSFWVSASTFNNGQYYRFALAPGQVRSFYAPVVRAQVPLFRVSFNSNATGPIGLPNENIVFESPFYRPAGTAGWPYAINFGVKGYFVTQI
jgi:hypothetical protein